MSLSVPGGLPPVVEGGGYLRVKGFEGQEQGADAEEITCVLTTESQVTVIATVTAAQPAASVSMPAGSTAQPPLSDYAPRPGTYAVSDNSSVLNVRSLAVSGVSAGRDQVRFTANAAGSAAFIPFDQQYDIAVSRRAGSDRLEVSMLNGEGAQVGFVGTVSYNADGSMTVTSTEQDPGPGRPVSLTIGRGGQPIQIQVTGLNDSRISVTTKPQ